ncbi:MAG: PAAR domain-containing protein [Rhodoferax sp.]|uniref:PAAR domain-containing protein n=1 Tax=Rhodoferax sp. TaxID=50421 RepID=UPI0032660457
MGKAFIVLGDKTSHGGSVVEASAQTTSGNIAVARVGDKVTCPIPGHGTNTIASGDPMLVVDGSPVARDGDKTACGATLIASQGATSV